MQVELILKEYRNTKENETKNKNTTPSDNVNAELNFLTIDDLIIRVARNDGIKDITEETYRKKYKEQYGGKLFKGKVVLVRCGIDVPINKKGRITGTERIQLAIPTLKELSDYGARIVVGGHQGRAGKENFIELDQHVKIIRKRINQNTYPRKTVKYLGNLTQSKTITHKIHGLKNGEILVLNNIRFLVDEVFIQDKAGLRPHEVNKGSRFVSLLEPLIDFYVNDAFNTSHRKHSSMIGFTQKLNIVGRHAEQEMVENKQVIHVIRYPFIPIFGGVKVRDYLGLIKNSVLSEKVPVILLAGVPGILAVLSQEIRPGIQYDFGSTVDHFLEDSVSRGLTKFFAELYARSAGRKKLIAPIDFMVKVGDQILNMTPQEIHEHPDKNSFHLWSIGRETTKRFVSYILRSKTIYKKGPVGKAEEPGFEQPEREILTAIMEAQKNGAYTITSGGDSTEIAKQLGFNDNALFSRLSDAGGAFIHVLEGNRIAWPMLQLNTHWNFFYGKDLRHGLPFNYHLKTRYRLEKIVPTNGLPEYLRYDQR
jgi:phosphoglycerate kinase